MSFVSKRNVIVAAAAIVVGTGALAQAQVTSGRTRYGVQPSNGKVVPVNPLTGPVGMGFAVPGTITAADTAIGLSGGDNNVLIYRNATPSNTNNNVLFRVDPQTGATLTSHAADAFTSDGCLTPDSRASTTSTTATPASTCIVRPAAAVRRFSASRPTRPSTR